MPSNATISSISAQNLLIFKVFAAIVLLSVFAAIAFDAYFVAGVPALLLLTYMTIVDFRKVFFFLIICIPLSTEFYFPNGLATDLPTEPRCHQIRASGQAVSAESPADGRRPTTWRSLDSAPA